jgi:hypothetical protein
MTMQWFRSHAKECSFLALLALSLQLALCFGHLHVDTRDTGARHASKIFAVDETRISAVDPARQDEPQHNDDYCAICSVMHLARSLVLSPVPFLLLPATYTQAQFAPENDAPAAELSRTAFQARGPPIL